MQGPEGRFNQYEARRPKVEPAQPRIPPSQNIVGNESEKRQMVAAGAINIPGARTTPTACSDDIMEWTCNKKAAAD